MERTDPASGEDVKRMVSDLGSTIQRTLAESPQIAHCLNRIRAEGYEVSLVLEATIGFNKLGSRETTEVSTFDFRVEKTEPAAIKMTPLDKKFLRSQFSVTENGKTRSGWQIITVDPLKTSLRAWTFDSNGGYGEAQWRRDGDHWVVSSHVTLADGGESRATNIVTRVDANTFTWQSTHRFLNDQPLEDLPPVRITRAPVAQVTKEIQESAK